jgi:uncharacterized protein
MKDTVIVFARAPRLGTVKRRLAKDIGERAALRFHAGTLIRLLRGLLRDRRFRTILALTPDGARDRLPIRVTRMAQGFGDIGRRMDAACRGFRRGNVAIVGSDIPEANAADLRLLAGGAWPMPAGATFCQVPMVYRARAGRYAAELPRPPRRAFAEIA